MTWKIITDSGACLTDIKTQSEQIQFERVPLTLHLDGKEIVDEIGLDIPTLIGDMKQSKTSSSSCPGPGTYEAAYEGADYFICFTITSGLSGSYNSARIAAEHYLDENPDVKGFVFDTRTAGSEMDLLANKAIELIESGHSFEEVVAGVKDYHQQTDILFLLESVENLAKNGRVNKVISSLVGLLNLRLLGQRTEEGTIELASKTRGTKRGLSMLLKEMKDRGHSGGRVSIVHVNNKAIAETLADKIKNKFGSTTIDIYPASGLCSFYGEENGLIVGFEKN